MKENLKKHKKKIIAFILSIFSFIPIGVNAIAVTTVALAIAGVGVVVTSIGFGTIGFANASYGNVPEGTYDNRLSLFDGLENNIPVCDESYENYCKSGTVPNISKMVDDNPYIIRYTIKISSTGNEYYIYGFYDDEYLNYLYSNSNSGYLHSPKYTISMLPNVGVDESFDNAFSSKPLLLGAFKPGDIYDSTNYIKRNKTWMSTGVASFWRYFYNYTNNNYTVKIETNFKLESTDINHEVVIGHQFNTDVDLTLDKNKYLMLIPKRNSSYTARIYTNNLFSYSFDYYDSNSLHYDSLDYGALTTLNMSSLGDFTWINWDIKFSDLDISSHKVIRIINPNDSILNIKIKSSDFYYKIMDSNSSSYCVGDICYQNDFDYMYNLGNSYNYELKYNNDTYDTGISFIKNIPNLLKEFVSSFAFIGTLFTTAFAIFNGSIANYFYIVFGLAIIILIFKVLR